MKTALFIEEMFAKGVLVNKKLLEQEHFTVMTSPSPDEDILVLSHDSVPLLQSHHLVDWLELDADIVQKEKEPQSANSFEPLPAPEQDSARTIEPNTASVNITSSFQNLPHKHGIADFTSIFTSRYSFLEAILRNRPEIQNLLPISRILNKNEREVVSLIGIIQEIETTKNGNIIIILEDSTGQIKIIFSKNKKELLIQAKDLVPDEVIGISGMYYDKVLFADKIIWPDVPNNELRINLSGPEEYAIFLSDIHVGSTLFLYKEFNFFLEWINGQSDDQRLRDIAQKVKYIFIVGDLVDGVGVYPSQESELKIKDIKEQYAEFTRLIKRIPSDKKIIICPGNHDVIYLAEPQPALYKNYVSELYSLPNITLVTNPAWITIAQSEIFSGYTVLMYHGYSFDHYVANVESIRANGGYQRADLIMKFLLKRRHLAPSFTSTPYFPGQAEDALLIKKIPDLLVTGHIHYCSVANYKGITTISCSCWQGKTTFQEKLGHKPEPARLPVVNLRDREVEVLQF